MSSHYAWRGGAMWNIRPAFALQGVFSVAMRRLVEALRGP
jgi:hypothetical protein